MFHVRRWTFAVTPSFYPRISPESCECFHPRASLTPITRSIAMKLKPLFLLVCLFAFAAPRAALARADVSFDFFYDSLSPYGEWIEVGDYGSCWRPSRVDADWSPYSDGYWSYTDGGWTWVSYEDFGGIVYHYGRWVQVEDEGWCWVPDDEWAPAWVSWRSNDDYVGWAPLPPEARWRRDTGISVWVDATYDIGPSRYNFCRVQNFGEPYLRPHIISRFENPTIIISTSNVTNISYYEGGGYGGLVHCGGPSFLVVNRFVNRPIPALKLVRNTNITNINIKQVNVFNSVQRGNQLAVLAPRVAARTEGLIRPQPVRTISADKINKGWAGVKDPEAQATIRTKLRQDAKNLSPENAPARRVQPVDLKPVPSKADPTAPSPVKTAKQRGAPVLPQTDKPVSGADQPVVVKPVDPRMLEKLNRQKAREDTKPGENAPAPAVVEQKKLEERTITKLPETKPVVTNPKVRTAPRPTTVEAARPPAPVKKFTAEPIERTPLEKPKASKSDAADKARDAVDRPRALAEQKERSATIERQRAVQDSMKKQNDAGAELKRREAAAEFSRKQEASQAATRQRQMEQSRPKPVDTIRKPDASEAIARQRQIDSSRQKQAADAARKQQSDAVRREQASQNARQLQVESARRQPAAPIQQPPKIERQAPVMKRQAPIIQQPPPPSGNQQAVPSSGGKRRLTPEEVTELQKKQGR